MNRNPAWTVPALTQAALLVLVSIAGAATLPVSYTVDSKTLKSDTPATTLLTVDLYENSLCTGVPLASESVAIDDFAITELIKQFKAKGATTTPAKVTRLNVTMEGVTPTAGADLFLKISGAGIASVGGDCQAQAAAGPAGPPGADGLDGTPGPSGTISCSTVTATCGGSASCSQTCAGGEQISGGGCSCPNSGVKRTSPIEGSPDSWFCSCTSPTDNVTVFAICCP